MADLGPVADVDHVGDRRGHGVLIEGDAGIGKTELWRSAATVAQEQGVRVLRAETSFAEAEFSYAALADLLVPVTDEVLDDLPPPQRTALDVALFRRVPEDVTVTARTVGMAVHGVLRRLAADGPLVVAVDDVQWLDEASTAALVFALRRLTDSKVRILGTLRTGSAIPELGASQRIVHSAAEHIWTSARQSLLTVVRLGPLRAAELGTLLAGRLGLRLPREELREMERQTGGNPFWALQTGAEILAAGRSGPIPVPRSLAGLLRQRLDRLAAPPRQVLAVASALADPALDQVMRTVTGVVDRPSDAVDEAVAAGVLMETNGTLRPAHPLLGAVAVSSMPPGQRRAMHLRLADVVNGPEQHARHMALAAEPGPDEHVAAILVRASEQVQQQGALAGAAELAATAARFIPADRVGDRAAALTRAAALFYGAGDAERASALLADVDTTAMDLASWAQLHRTRVDVALLLRGRGEASALAERALAEAGGDAARRVVALALTIDTDDSSDPSRRAARAEEAIRHAGDVGLRHPLFAEVLLSLVNARLDSGHGLELSMLERAEELEAGLRWTSVADRVVSYRGYLLKSVDEIAGSRTALHEAMALARQGGEDGSLPFFRGHLALTEFWAGNYAAARRSLAEATPAGLPPSMVVIGLGALLEAVSGDPAIAAELLAAEPDGPTAKDPRGQLFREHAAGVIALLRDDPERAVSHLQTALRLSEHLGVREPGRRRRLEGDLGASLVRVGELAPARTLAAELCRLGEGHGRDTLTGIGLRVDGLVAAAEGDLDTAVTHLTEAVALHRASQLRLEWGLSLLALGQVLRRKRAWQAAREALHLAAVRFTELGAPTYLAQAEAERAVVGRMRSGPSGTLTRTEQRVAELVADGRSNREVAAVLFTSVRTVEGHLSAIYRKLGVRSRTQLAATLPGLSAQWPIPNGPTAADSESARFSALP
ncbi:AAA family ATPase [Micromonospora tarapacensis]|uniref:AAA family ATPase n=1 Tax=Micromonospora tarapacensis TaxID=2835305 RepID=UPI002F416910